jgi:hypothetical protein
MEAKIVDRYPQLCPNWASAALKSVDAMAPSAADRFHAFGPPDGPRSKAGW